MCVYMCLHMSMFVCERMHFWKWNVRIIEVNLRSSVRILSVPREARKYTPQLEPITVSVFLHSTHVRSNRTILREDTNLSRFALSPSIAFVPSKDRVFQNRCSKVCESD